MRMILLFSALALCQLMYSQVTNVSTATELQNALNAANPGEVIQISDGYYERSGGFYVNAGRHGTSSQPITIKGSVNVFLSTGTVNSSYGFTLKGNDYWVLEDFTVRNCKKGIMLDESNHNILRNISVRKVGEEGIHFRTYSSYNTLENSFVDSTGIVNAGYGEAIYIGTANSNWSNYTNGNPDTCNYNVIKNNTFGDHVSAENIDIKEGTKHGVITENTFNGKGLTGANYADSWIDVKGNYYTIKCNIGSNTMKNGFETHIAYAGWGDYNVFTGNDLDVDPSGWGIYVQTSGSKGTANGNEVCDNNLVNAGAKGLSSVSTVTCSNTCLITWVKERMKKGIKAYPNPTFGIVNLDRSVYFEVFDLTGKRVLVGQGNKLNLSNLDQGVYLLKSEQSFSRIIKK